MLRKRAQKVSQAIINKLSALDKVESIYTHFDDGKYCVLVFIKVNKYDDKLIENLIEKEMELEDSFLDMSFEFHHIPVSVSKNDILSLSTYDCLLSR